MRLLAISDLHLGYEINRQAVRELSPHPEDWLIVAGDVGETRRHLEEAWRVLCPKFARVLWVPGNHELWTTPSEPLRGQEKYDALVELCRTFGVVTPEDPFVTWDGPGGPCRLAPTFLLYDYSFRPDDVPHEQALEWAVQSGVLCVDEQMLQPDPHPDIGTWCERRVALTERRLAEAAKEAPLVLINHYPLKYQLVRMPRIPGFTVWCGTRRTEDWHQRFRVRVAVAGHLHIRTTDWIDGVRFEEVSLGYPRQWNQEKGLEGYLREILPGPTFPEDQPLSTYHP